MATINIIREKTAHHVTTKTVDKNGDTEKTDETIKDVDTHIAGPIHAIDVRNDDDERISLIEDTNIESTSRERARHTAMLYECVKEADDFDDVVTFVRSEVLTGAPYKQVLSMFSDKFDKSVDDASEILELAAHDMYP